MLAAGEREGKKKEGRKGGKEGGIPIWIFGNETRYAAKDMHEGGCGLENIFWGVMTDMETR